MNRELLFRGFHECEDGKTVIKVDGIEKRGVWLHGNLVEDSDGSFIVQEKESRSPWSIEKVIPSTVGQFTGLVDKNGKRTFERDIMTEGAYNRTVKIVFENGEFYGDGGTYGGKIISLSKEETVIGNIFENPELLGGENNG